jgi:hypothetical protein
MSGSAQVEMSAPRETVSPGRRTDGDGAGHDEYAGDRSSRHRSARRRASADTGQGRAAHRPDRTPGPSPVRGHARRRRSGSAGSDKRRCARSARKARRATRSASFAAGVSRTVTARAPTWMVPGAAKKVANSLGRGSSRRPLCPRAARRRGSGRDERFEGPHELRGSLHLRAMTRRRDEDELRAGRRALDPEGPGAAGTGEAIRLSL